MAIPNYMLYEFYKPYTNESVATNIGCTITPISTKDFLGRYPWPKPKIKRWNKQHLSLKSPRFL